MTYQECRRLTSGSDTERRRERAADRCPNLSTGNVHRVWALVDDLAARRAVVVDSNLVAALVARWS